MSDHIKDMLDFKALEHRRDGPDKEAVYQRMVRNFKERQRKKDAERMAVELRTSNATVTGNEGRKKKVPPPRGPIVTNGVLGSTDVGCAVSTGMACTMPSIPALCSPMQNEEQKPRICLKLRRGLDYERETWKVMMSVNGRGVSHGGEGRGDGLYTAEKQESVLRSEGPGGV